MANAPQRGGHVYRGRELRNDRGMFESDHAEAHSGGRFRWLISTFLAAAVGAVAILVVVYGSSDTQDSGGIVPTLKRLRETSKIATPGRSSQSGGLRWEAPKGDLQHAVAAGTSTRFVIHDTLKQKRNGREYILAKPYIRVVSKLGPVANAYADVIPPFNPYKLYSNNTPVSTAASDSNEVETVQKDVQVKVVELLGGILPGEDGQQLDTQEVSDIIERARESSEAPPVDEPIEAPATDAGAGMAGMQSRRAGEAKGSNTTNLTKNSNDGDDAADDNEGREDHVVSVVKGDTSLAKVLVRAGAETWQAAEMVAAAAGIFPDSALTPGQEVRLTTTPSLTDPGRMDAVQFSVFGPGHALLVTVTRNSSGEFAGSTNLADEMKSNPALAESSGEGSHASSLYAALYAAGLTQGETPDTIMQILRIHAYETDFRRRVRAGDQVESFFDARDDNANDGPPGELLFTSIASGNESSRFYRFRTPDGVVDYYDEHGNNSRKFLNRRPVRSDDVRLVSGFGIRFHPLLGVRKMHTGVDWASAMGTPIMAAGNGVVEEAGRKSGYGNYVRIRHANGYQTAYGHISRFAPGLQAGTKVKQGQTIAYIGCTGLCQGPHVHFEVLVNNRFVDPMSIQVPRERRLSGKLLAEFQKERSRIDDLMHRPPVMTQTR